MALKGEAQEKPEKPASLPTGTVTFLFSDIEGSTQRWETHREAMKAAVARHEHLMNAAIKQHGGYVFKIMGDAFCAAFPTAPEAIAAACDAQFALAQEDFSSVDGLLVRMGLHTGNAEERNADYFGPAVNRVARLMSIGHGGQILLSGVTRDLAHNDLPAGVSLIDLGSHRLKDLTEPEQVWQLTIEGLPVEFPPPKSLDTFPNNLPIQPTSFRGREHDLEEAKSLLRQHKLLTLFGSGGVGKTRLALQVGADVLGHYPDGVWFADFAAITDPELVSSVIAKELGMTQAKGRRVDEPIPQWLKRKKLLLILDNCEHVLEAVASLADAIIRSCPDVRTLATSRQALGIAGEVVYRLPSLALPETTIGLKADEAVHYAAIALFVDRAQASDAHFTIDDHNAPAVGDLCCRLDGIPLAIELAAARVKVLSISDLVQSLDERFTTLTSGSRTALPRQKTLRALIDWSYDLLTPQEQTLFNRVSIFAGSFTLKAATSICVGNDIDTIKILDLLASLTDKSLVVANTSGEHARYRLLETTRAYSLEKLAAKGEREQLARRHADYFRELAQAAYDEKDRGETSDEAWLARVGLVGLELDNFRGALDWALSQRNDAVLGGAIVGALSILWSDCDVAEGRRWVGAALECIDEAEHPGIVARLWLALAMLSFGKRSYDAAERARVLYALLGDGRGVARAHKHVAFVLYIMGRMDEATDANERALAACRKLKNRRDVADCLLLKANISTGLSHFDAGRRTFAEALTAFRAIGNERGVAVTLMDLAELEFAAGNPTQALGYVGEARDILRVRTSMNLVLCYVNSVAYNIALGHFDGALEAAREGLGLGRRRQNTPQIAFCIQHLAVIVALRGEAQRAARLKGYVDIVLQELGIHRFATEKWSYEKLIASLSEHLNEAKIAELAGEGAAWSEDQAVEEALKV